MSRLQRWTIALVVAGSIGADNLWTSSAQATNSGGDEGQQVVRLDGGVDASGVGSVMGTVAESPRE